MQPAWQSSFKIDVDQVNDLLKQTPFSVFFFQGPPLNGRGIPVIPTQLVADLSRRNGSGTTLPRQLVGSASRSLADWFTYEVLGLWAGDPFKELLDRVDGRPGAYPRPMLEVPTVEISVALTTATKVEDSLG